MTHLPDCMIRGELCLAYQELQEQLIQAKAGIESLRYLQKYEGHQKAESDQIGHDNEVRLLKEEITRLRAELDKANSGAGTHPPTTA